MEEILNNSEATALECKYASKIAMKWLIKEKTLRETKEKRLYSPQFAASKIPGTKFSLCFAPNGIDDNQPNKVWIFFHLDFTITKKINAEFDISVKSASKKVQLKHEYSKGGGWGTMLCTRDELFDDEIFEKKFLVDGILTLELNGTLKPQGLKRKATSPNPSVLTRALWEKDDKDITLSVKRQKVMVHKWILIARSPVFEAMFKHGMKEATENKVIITDFTVDIIKIASEFLYERDIKALITDANAADLLRFADKYDMPDMKSSIESSLIDKLSEANVCQYSNMAFDFNCDDLREFCLCFLIKYFDPPSFFDGVETLNDEVTKEIALRLVLPIAKTV